ERSGLKPAGSAGYIQPVKLRSRRIVEERSSLALVRNGKRRSLALGEDAIFSMRTETPRSVSAPMVFVGYGLVAPEENYNELAGDWAPSRLSVTFNPAHADTLLAGSGRTFTELLAMAEAGKPLPTFPIPGTLEARVEVERSELESQNVVAAFPGSDRRLNQEY